MNPSLRLEDEGDHHHGARFTLTVEKSPEPSGAHENIAVHHDSESGRRRSESNVARLGLVQEVRLEDESGPVAEAAHPVIAGPIRDPSDHNNEVVGLGRLPDQCVQALGQAREPVPNIDDYRALVHHSLRAIDVMSFRRSGTLPRLSSARWGLQGLGQA